MHHVTVAHKRVPLVTAALSLLLVVTGHQLCIHSAVFHSLHRCPPALLCPYGCNWVLPRWVFLQHSKTILSFRDLIFFKHVHLEWTYSQVLSRVYCSSGVGLRLLERLEKSLITKSPHWYVSSETRLVPVRTLWDGPRVPMYSRKPKYFWRIFTPWQLWQKPTPTPSPGFWYLRWGWVFLERMRILSGIQFTTHFIEIFVMETKSSVVLYTWSWGGKPAASARARLRKENAER